MVERHRPYQLAVDTLDSHGVCSQTHLAAKSRAFAKLLVRKHNRKLLIDDRHLLEINRLHIAGKFTVFRFSKLIAERVRMKNERRADQKRHIKYPRSGQQYFCPAWKLAVGHIIERPRAAVCKLECQLSKAHQRPGADINCDNGRPE